MPNLRKLWGWKHSQVGASNTEMWPDLSKSPYDTGYSDSGFGGEDLPDGSSNSALFYNNNGQPDEVTDPWAQLGFLYTSSAYNPVRMFDVPCGTWATSSDMRYAEKPGTDFIVGQINALEDMDIDWYNTDPRYPVYGGLTLDFDRDNWMTEGRKLVPGTTTRACVYQLARMKSNIPLVFNQTADQYTDPAQNDAVVPIFQKNGFNLGIQAKTSTDFSNIDVVLAGEQDAVDGDRLYHSSLDPTPTSKENFLKGQGRVVQATVTDDVYGYRKEPDYGKTVDIAYEIEMALYKYGVAIDSIDIKNTNSVAGYHSREMLTYTAGMFAFNWSPYDQSAGYHLLIPCYVKMGIRDTGLGRPTASLGYAPMYRYVVVAIRLERKFSPGSYIPGSGAVLDFNMTSDTQIASPINAWMESAASGQGWDNWVGENATQQLNYGQGYTWNGSVEPLNENSSAADTPVICFRWEPDGKHFYIVGGNIGLSAPTKSGGGSNIYHCIKKIGVGYSLANALEMDSFYQIGHYYFGSVGATNACPMYREPYFSDVQENRIVDLDPRETGIWDNAWVGGEEKYYFQSLADLLADNRTYVSSKYGFNASATNPSEVAPKYPQTVLIDGQSVEEQILTFRWSEDGLYLYVVWGVPYICKRNTQSSGSVRQWVARYRTTQPFVTAYLKWCGETDTTDTPITPEDGATNITEFFGVRDITISPDRNELIVLDNPYNTQWADGRAAYPGDYVLPAYGQDLATKHITKIKDGDSRTQMNWVPTDFNMYNSTGDYPAFYNGFSFTPDGRRVFVNRGSNNNNTFYAMDLKEPWLVARNNVWNLEESENLQSVVTASGQTSMSGPDLRYMIWKPDGTRFYIANAQDTDTYCFKCNTPWRVEAGLSYVHKANFNIEDGAFWEPSGQSLFYIQEYNTPDRVSVIKKTFTTAWDISSFVTSQTFIQLNPNSTDDARGLMFSSDGKTMYVCGRYRRNKIFVYELATAWDLSSISVDSNSYAIPTSIYGISYPYHGTSSTDDASYNGSPAFILPKGNGNDGEFLVYGDTRYDQTLTTGGGNSNDFAVSSYRFKNTKSSIIPDVTHRNRYPNLSTYDLGEFDEMKSNMPLKSYSGSPWNINYIVDEDDPSYRFSTNPLVTDYVSAPTKEMADSNLAQYGYVRRIWWRWPQTDISLGDPASSMLKSNSTSEAVTKTALQSSVGSWVPTVSGYINYDSNKIAFNANGTSAFVAVKKLSPAEYGFIEFPLSVQYDLSTATASGRTTYHSIVTSTSGSSIFGSGGLNDFKFSPDGTKFIYSSSTGTVLFSLSTPYDLSSYTELDSTSSCVFGNNEMAASGIRQDVVTGDYYVFGRDFSVPAQQRLARINLGDLTTLTGAGIDQTQTINSTVYGIDVLSQFDGDNLDPAMSGRVANARDVWMNGDGTRLYVHVQTATTTAYPPNSDCRRWILTFDIPKTNRWDVTQVTHTNTYEITNEWQSNNLGGYHSADRNEVGENVYAFLYPWQGSTNNDPRQLHKINFPFRQANFLWLNKKIVGVTALQQADAYSDWLNKSAAYAVDNTTNFQTCYVEPTAMEWNVDGSELFMFQSCSPFSRGSDNYVNDLDIPLTIPRVWGEDDAVIMWSLPMHPRGNWYPNPPRPGGQSTNLVANVGMDSFASTRFYPWLYNYSLRGLFEQTKWLMDSMRDYDKVPNNDFPPYAADRDNFYSTYAIPPNQKMATGSTIGNYLSGQSGADNIEQYYRDTFSYDVDDQYGYGGPFIGYDNVDSFAVPIRSWSHYNTAANYHDANNVIGDSGQVYIPFPRKTWNAVNVTPEEYGSFNPFGWSKKVLMGFSPSGHFMTIIGQMGYTTYSTNGTSYKQAILTFPIYRDSATTLRDTSVRLQSQSVGSSYDGSNSIYKLNTGSRNTYYFFRKKALNINSGATSDDFQIDTAWDNGDSHQIMLGPKVSTTFDGGSERWGNIQYAINGSTYGYYNIVSQEYNFQANTFDREKYFQITDGLYDGWSDVNSVSKLRTLRDYTNYGKVQVGFKDIPQTLDAGGVNGRQLVTFNLGVSNVPITYTKDRRQGMRGISLYATDFNDYFALERYFSTFNTQSSATEYKLLNSTFLTMNWKTDSALDNLPIIRYTGSIAYYNNFLVGNSETDSPHRYLLWLDQDYTYSSPIIYKKQLLARGDLNTAYQAFSDGGEVRLDVGDHLYSTSNTVLQNKGYFDAGLPNQGIWEFSRDGNSASATRNANFGRITSIRYEDGGKKLFVLWNGRSSELDQWEETSPDVYERVDNTDPSTSQYMVMLRYDLSNPYDLSTATYIHSYLRSGGYNQNYWAATRQPLAYLDFASDFVWKPDGTKFWTIGSETTVLSGSPFFINSRDCHTIVREYDVATPFDLSTITQSTNVKTYDTAPGGIQTNTQLWAPKSLEVSPDGLEVYWSMRLTSINSGTDNGVRSFKSTLPTAWDVTSPSQSTSEPFQGSTRTFVGLSHEPSDGSAERIRFVNSEGRRYRTNNAQNSVSGAVSTSNKWSQSWPLGGISVWDPEQKTQKRSGQISIGNYTMFPFVFKGVATESYTEAFATGQERAQTFNFAVSPTEDLFLVNDGQDYIYQLLFNNQTRKRGVGP